MALTYLDTSVVAALFLADAYRERAYRILGDSEVQPAISDFVAAEFASSIARRVRMGELTKREAGDAFVDFDRWRANSVANVLMDAADMRAVEAILRRLDLPLRAPDALHIAIAQRIGAELATFDEKMASSAHTLAVPLAKI